MRQVYPLVASVGLQRAKARTKPKGGPPFAGSRPSESAGRQGERGSGDQSDSRPPVLQTQPSNPITPPVTRPPDARPGEQRLQPEAHPVGPLKCRTATESARPDIIVTGRSTHSLLRQYLYESGYDQEVSAERAQPDIVVTGRSTHSLLRRYQYESGYDQRSPVRVFDSQSKVLSLSTLSHEGSVHDSSAFSTDNRNEVTGWIARGDALARLGC